MVMRPGRQNRGAAYLLLLLLIALLGGLAAIGVTAGGNLARRDAEDALLTVGGEFERALLAYRLAPRAGVNSQGPRSLEDLLGDAHADLPRRYLRRLYEDPLTGKADWGLVRASDGRVVAVYSRAVGVPVKRAGFEPRGEEWFAQAPSYSAWCFGLAAADPSDQRLWIEAHHAGCLIPQLRSGR